MKFVLFKDKKHEWRWKLLARNGKSIAVSGEGYKRSSAARRAIYRVRASGNTPLIVED